VRPLSVVSGSVASSSAECPPTAFGRSRFQPVPVGPRSSRQKSCGQTQIAAPALAEWRANGIHFDLQRLFCVLPSTVSDLIKPGTAFGPVGLRYSESSSSAGPPELPRSDPNETMLSRSFLQRGRFREPALGTAAAGISASFFLPKNDLRKKTSAPDFVAGRKLPVAPRRPGRKKIIDHRAAWRIRGSRLLRGNGVPEKESLSTRIAVAAR